MSSATGPIHVLDVALRDCFCGSEQAGLETRLAALPGVHGAHVDRTRAVVHVTYDPAFTSEPALRDQLHRWGYRCECRDCPQSCCQPGHPAISATDACLGDSTPPAAAEHHGVSSGHGDHHEH